MNIKKEIQRIMHDEINVLHKIVLHIDKSYEKAINLILKSKGKVIVTGVGKSGHIANKIAATLSSTGTPSIFLHPTEAVHGDLGIVNKNDILICISKSGESEELFNVILSLKKRGVKIIGITSDIKSTLAEKSDVVLNLMVDKEACPYDLAPTTSTTASLLIGDALAITLMKIKKFKPEDFALFHPAGKLGRRLLFKVEDIMRKGKDNPIIKINDTVKNMLIEITRKHAGAISVIDKNNKLLGLVTDYDIRRAIESGKNIFLLCIKDIMNKNPKYIFNNEKASAAFNVMENNNRPFSMMPVLDEKTKKVVGMLHIHDILSKKII
jgi:arabinose-5-phosphate isomerase